MSDTQDAEAEQPHRPSGKEPIRTVMVGGEGGPEGEGGAEGKGVLGLFRDSHMFTKHRARPKGGRVRGARAQPPGPLQAEGLLASLGPSCVAEGSAVSGALLQPRASAVLGPLQAVGRASAVSGALLQACRGTCTHSVTGAAAGRKWEEEVDPADTSLVHCDRRKQLSRKDSRAELKRRPRTKRGKLRQGYRGARAIDFSSGFRER